MSSAEWQNGGGGSREGEVALSVPPTPEGTPAPLFSSRRIDSMSYERDSMPRCQCFLKALRMGVGPGHSCLITHFKAPDVTLKREVLVQDPTQPKVLGQQKIRV